MLREGEKAPSFTLRATGGRTVSLADFRGRRNVVLFFYHQDDTSACTREVEAFRDLYEDFEQSGTAILAISADSILDHDAFARKCHVRFHLCSDQDRLIWNAYSSCRGDKRLSSEDHITFVIDREGIVCKIWPEVDVEGHANEVLAFVKGLSAGQEE